MPHIWNQYPLGLYVYIPPDYNYKNKFIFFDLDGTLVKPKSTKFPKDEHDNIIMDNRVNKLKELIKLGYNIIIFTNQKVTPKSNVEAKLKRMNDVIDKFLFYDITLTILVSTEESKYRKPNIGMWEAFIELFQNISFDKNESFYCGDAAGRLSDFSDSDIIFAKNIGIKFLLPEEVF